MKLRTITFLTAFAQAAACGVSGVDLAQAVRGLLENPGARFDQVFPIVSWGIQLLAQAVLAFFLFLLSSRQSAN